MLPDHFFRDILLDLRENMLRQITIIVFIAGYCLMNIGLLTRPISNIAVGLSIGLMLISVLHLRLLKLNGNLSRYSYVICLHLFLFLALARIDSGWLEFLGLPLVLMSGLLVTRSSLASASAIFLFLFLLESSGQHDFPLAPLLALYGFSTAITMTAINKFYVALTWYSSMHDRADHLLHETRNRRAELVQAVKSLEISYENQRRMQQQLVYARQQATEARRMKERFAANISHELRTPLNLILGFTEILYFTPEVYGDVEFPPKMLRDIHQIYSNSRHLLEMIDDVLDLSHVEMSEFATNLENTDMNHFLLQTVALLENLFVDTDVRLITNIEAGLPMVEIDSTRMRQVLLNLCNNAQRFTQHGTVTLSACYRNGEVVVTLADTGIGIPEDKLPLIFDEFFQVDFSLSRSHGGAGLGLAITKRFVEAHGGRLTVESYEGKGSTFTFTIPAHRSRLAIPYLESADQNDQPVVLVVDADPAVVTMVARHLKHYQVEAVTDKSTLDHAIHHYLPHAIIYNQKPGNSPSASLDLAFNPDGITVVNCSLPSMAWLTESLGVTACLSKPITSQQLADQIRQLSSVKSVLIVDDDLGFVQLVQRTIETLQMREQPDSPPELRIFRAYDGQQAMDVIYNQQPDLLLLDLAMPDMSGFEVIEKVRADPTLASMSIILLTATRYVESETQFGTDLSIYQSEGLNPAQVLRCINVLVAS
ncbi:MAG: hybrid sensor histidine kinase/response regulator [Aggregatilineales bacterium]